MGMITVAGPNGDVQFEIDGDKPTQAELAEIDRILYPDEYRARETSSKSPVSGASLAQIREYARMREQAGITPEGTQMSPEDYAAVYQEEGVDYTQGLQDIGNFSRFGYGRMETDEGRANYLRRSIGEGGFRKDALGRFVLTQKGRQNLGMEAGPEIAIDEEGLSWGDFSEFLGQNALPMAAGIGAGLAATGVGAVPGLLIAGGAAAAGKALDEGIEYAQGLQDQTFDGVMRDVAFEGAFGMLGEGIGRSISAAAGRLIKGPGGEAGEASRARLRDLLSRNFRPTVSGGGGDEFRPILGRVQGMYEAIFPNKKAAELNAKTIIEELRSLRVADEDQIDALSEVLKRDVERIYGTADDSLVRAQKALDTAVEKSLGKVYASLRTEGFAPKDIIGAVQLSKRIFDENMDSVFTQVDDILGGQAIIPTSGIKAELESLSLNSAADVASTKFAKMVSDLPQYATIKDIARIRTALAEATSNPGLVADVNMGALSALKNSINMAVNGVEVFLQRSVDMPLEAGKVFGPEGFTASFENMSKALGVLRRANSLYRRGMERFDNAVTQNILAQARRRGGVNEKFVLEQIIEKDNPEALRQLLMAVRGAWYMPGLEMGERTAKKLRVLNMPIETARREMALLPEGSEAKRALRREIRRVEEMAAASAGAAGKGVDRAEELRQNLAKMYLDSVVAKSKTRSPETGAIVIDPVTFVARIREKGKVFNELFKGEKDQIDDLISVLGRAKDDIAPSVFEEMLKRNPTLTGVLSDLRATQTAKKDLSRDQLLRLAESGDTENLARMVLQSPANAEKAAKLFSADALESLRDIAMNRILRQANIATDVTNQPKMSEAFLDTFTSGSLGKSFQSVINSYGDKSIDNLFGAGTAKALNGIADDMINVSNAAIRGKGGLVAASSAAALTGFAVIFNPVTVLSAAAVPFVMSKALRNPAVLRLLTASRNKNTLKQLLSGKFKADDVIGQGLQAMNLIVAQALSYGVAGMATQGEEETRALQELSRREAETARQDAGVNRMIEDLGRIGQGAVQSVTSPMQALAPSAPPAPALPPAQPPSGVSAPLRVNPILVPNPTTRATFGG